MKKYCIAAFLMFLFFSGFSQAVSQQNLHELKHKEDTLKSYADKLINGYDAVTRFKSDSLFTKLFVRALKTPLSFNYPFDSLLTISKLYAPDNSFRIFTWQLVVNENLTRQHGAIQMNTADGSLKLYPLIDKSDVTQLLADTTANNKGWIGAVYYKIIETKGLNKNYYTLLGYDENNIRSNRKIIEVLSFNNEEPVFGGALFSFDEDSTAKPATSRHILEYKKTAGTRLVYDPELQMIIAEHLESETNEPLKKWTYIPDGDYEGFKWKNNKWVHVEKVFNQVTAEGAEPMPKPVKDAMGNTIEDRLKDNVEEGTSPVEDMPVEKKPALKLKAKPKVTKPKGKQ
jgi:hypothetical protein